MSLKLTPLFKKSDINKWIKQFQDNAEMKIYTTLQAAGEEFVRQARLSGVYDNHSGNLRSSIGYVITKDNSIVSENFEIQNVGTDGKEGVQKAKKLARELARDAMSGYGLIGVAGMEYAMYVEAIDGKDVITGASIQAEERLRKSIKTVLEKV